jgi:hypothetical protein
VCDHVSCLRGLSAERVESELVRVLEAAKGSQKSLRR